MRVAEGIELVEGSRIGNAYLVVGEAGVLLVDTGMFGGAARILAAMSRLGRQPQDLRHIVLTHWHPDHMANAAALRRLTGARIAIHTLDAPALAGDGPVKGRRTMGLLLRLLRVAPLAADIMLGAGDRIDGLEVIHVPGHTAGSIALRRDDGVVFSGDALLGDRKGRLRPPDPRLTVDLNRATESAARLRALEPRVLLPGHGAPIGL